MDIIHVITTFNGFVQNIESFPIYEDQLSYKEVSDSAESYFYDLVMSSMESFGLDTLSPDEQNDILDNAIMDRYFEHDLFIIQIINSQIN